MRGVQRLAAVAIGALVLGASDSSDAVNPKGRYSMTGEYLWRTPTIEIEGTHAGWFKVNGLKFIGKSVETGGYTCDFQLLLNRKVRGQGISTRQLTGQFTRSTTAPQFTTLYQAVNGVAQFKVTSNGRVKYQAAVGGSAIAGYSLRSAYGGTFKGVKNLD